MARRNIQGESPQWVDRAEAEHHPKQPHRTRIQRHLACHITGAYITCQGRAFRRGPDLLTAPMSEHSKRFTSLFPFPCHLNGMGWYCFGLGCGLGCQHLDSRCIFVCVWAFVKYYIDILDFACTNIYLHIFFGDRTPEEWRVSLCVTFVDFAFLQIPFTCFYEGINDYDAMKYFRNWANIIILYTFKILYL